MQYIRIDDGIIAKRGYVSWYSLTSVLHFVWKSKFAQSTCSLAGLLGLANGLTVLLLGNGVPMVTFALLIIEGVLGWFFFSVFVLSSYPFMVARAAGPMPGLTGIQSNAVTMMVSAPELSATLYDCHLFTSAS